MTLKELYENARRKPKPPTPAVAFVREMAQVTKKSEIAVRRWLGEGSNACVPDALTQQVLADHFGTTPEELFPPTDAARRNRVRR